MMPCAVPSMAVIGMPIVPRYDTGSFHISTEESQVHVNGIIDCTSDSTYTYDKAIATDSFWSICLMATYSSLVVLLHSYMPASVIITPYIV